MRGGIPVVRTERHRGARVFFINSFDRLSQTLFQYARMSSVIHAKAKLSLRSHATNRFHRHLLFPSDVNYCLDHGLRGISPAQS